MTRRKLLFKILPNTRYGELTPATPDGATCRFTGDREGEQATMILKDWTAVDAILARGDIGLGESYMANLWETPDEIPQELQRDPSQVGALSISRDDPLH